jgi:hypothetical protein
MESHHALARELGYGSYREMCQELKGIDLPALQAETDAFAAATEADYPMLLEPQLQRVLGIGFAELRPSDLPRFFRDPDSDRQFPADRLVPTFIESLRGLGIGEQWCSTSRPGRTNRPGRSARRSESRRRSAW